MAFTAFFNYANCSTRTSYLESWAISTSSNFGNTLLWTACRLHTALSIRSLLFVFRTATASLFIFWFCPSFAQCTFTCVFINHFIFFASWFHALSICLITALVVRATFTFVSNVLTFRARWFLAYRSICFGLLAFWTNLAFDHIFSGTYTFLGTRVWNFSFLFVTFLAFTFFCNDLIWLVTFFGELACAIFLLVILTIFADPLIDRLNFLFTILAFVIGLGCKVTCASFILTKNFGAYSMF